MDPLADKLLIIAALVSLVSLDRLAAWVAMVIIARELAVTGLRSVAAERGGRDRRELAGQGEDGPAGARGVRADRVKPTPLWVDVLLYVAVAVTVISGADYFFGLRRRIAEAEAHRRTAGRSGRGAQET